MQKIIIIIIFFFLLNDVNGQICDESKHESYSSKVHNIVGLIPSNARVTNGWGIGWSSSLEHCVYMDSIRINGIYTNISPFQAIVASMGLIMLPFAVFMEKPNKYEDTKSYDRLRINHKLNGVSIGLFELGEEFTMQGLQITALHHYMDKLNGVSFTMLHTEYKHFNGLMISGIHNKAYKGRGVQIGLINKTKKMKGVQIGLWNVIGEKGFPIINMRFKDNNTK